MINVLEKIWFHKKIFLIGLFGCVSSSYWLIDDSQALLYGECDLIAAEEYLTQLESDLSSLGIEYQEALPSDRITRSGGYQATEHFFGVSRPLNDWFQRYIRNLSALEDFAYSRTNKEADYTDLYNTRDYHYFLFVQGLRPTIQSPIAQNYDFETDFAILGSEEYLLETAQAELLEDAQMFYESFGNSLMVSACQFPAKGTEDLIARIGRGIPALTTTSSCLGDFGLMYLVSRPSGEPLSRLRIGQINAWTLEGILSDERLEETVLSTFRKTQDQVLIEELTNTVLENRQQIHFWARMSDQQSLGRGQIAIEEQYQRLNGLNPDDGGILATRETMDKVLENVFLICDKIELMCLAGKRESD